MRTDQVRSRPGAGKLSVVALLALLWVGTSLAEDAFPPSWRGQPGTTYQDWSFATANNPAAPDAAANANGTAQVSLVVGAFGTGWNSSSLGGETGVWDLGQAGQATAVVPNFGGSPPSKTVQVQVTYFDAPGFYLPPTISIAGATLLSTQLVETLPAPPGNWKTLQTVWLLQPAPASETVVFEGDASKGLLLDEIIVDTRCASSLSVDLAGSQNPATLGSNFLSTVTVSNAGPNTVSGVLLSNAFSAGQLALSVTNGLSGIGQACPLPGPRAWWRAEANTQDAAGTNAGTLSGGVSFVLGEVGQAFSFDGTSGSVSVPDSPALQPQSLTLEAWLKPQSFTGHRFLLGKRVGAGTWDSYSLWLDSGSLSAAVSGAAGPGPVLSCALPAGQWIHVAYTFDSAAQAQALYLNGQLVNASLLNQTIAYDAHPLLLGADDTGGSPGAFYQGAMDELTLYDRALSGSEVRAIYDAGAGGKSLTPGTVPLGSLAGGTSAQVVWVSVPITCQPLSVSATVAGANPASLTVPVQALPGEELLLSLEPVGGNASLLRVSWPLTCSPAEVQSADSLATPVPWMPAGLPVFLLDNRNCTILPLEPGARFLRVHVP